MPRKPQPSFITEQEVFPTRLRELMKQRNINQKQLAEVIEMRPQTISLYVTGQSAPDINTLKKLSEFFGVSADYFLGITNIQSPDTNTKAICEYTKLPESAVLSVAKIAQYPTANILDRLLSHPKFPYLLGKIRRLILAKSIRDRFTSSQEIQPDQIFKELVSFTKYEDKVDVAEYRISTEFKSILDSIVEELSTESINNFSKEEIQDFISSI